MNRLAVTQIALCGVIVVATVAVSMALVTRKVCVPPPPPKSYGDCSQNTDPGLAYCYLRDGRVFMWWKDGRWLEVAPKNGATDTGESRE